MMLSWPGRPLDDNGLLRVLNENGTRPPLLWIFNAAHEPGTLAAYLGEDQPLVFSRSNHLITRPEDNPVEIRSALSEYLLEQIKVHYPSSAFDIGTSCQGTGIVMNLSSALPKIGVRVGHLCLINSPLPDQNASHPALLIYGDEDKGQDPFEVDEPRAKRQATSSFSSYTRKVVQARHGEFYSENVLKQILPEFDAFRRQP